MSEAMPASVIAAARLELGEVEDGVASAAYLRYRESATARTTSVDVLEISRDFHPHVQWHQGLDHDALLRRFAASHDEQRRADDLSLRILFVNVTPTDNQNGRRKGSREVIPLASPQTMEWLRSRFGVSVPFLDSLVDPSWGARPGNSCHNRCNDIYGFKQTDALYHFISDDPVHIWLSIYGAYQRTTYITSNFPSKAKLRILQCAAGSAYQSLLHPLAVDTYIADAAAESRRNVIRKARENLFFYEDHGASITSEPLQNTFQDLHELSRTWHILHESLVDHQENMHFAMNVHRNHYNHQATSNAAYSTLNYEAMEFLSSRNRLWTRWVDNYTTRTQIRINLFFNLANQSDNRTNMDIAKTSKEIAEATLKDSSSMITIAAVTMLFLPGTFVSSVFSMSFFNNGIDASGKPILTILSQWWYFPLATIPLTIIVFGTWKLWQQNREHRIARAESQAHMTQSRTRSYNQRFKNLLARKARDSSIVDPTGEHGMGMTSRGNDFTNLFSEKAEAGITAVPAGKLAP